MTYVGAFLLAAVVAALLTPAARRLGLALRAIDLPGDPRKIHTVPIPRLGGVAVVAAFFVPLLGLSVYTNRISYLVYQDLRLVGALALGASGIVGLGIYDDIKGASARLKLFVQTLVAIGMWGAGFRVEVLGNPFGGAIDLGLLSLPVTVFWMVGVINALNLIDGLDGLAAGVSMFACIVLFGVSYVGNAVLVCTLLAALAGSLLGFLFFNFNPAKIFLGDSGSMFLGFILASVAVWTQQKGATAAALLVPLLALGLPLLDTALSVVRRVGQGKSPFAADREHLHHRMLALGLSHRNAVLTLYTVSGVFALGGLAMLDSDTTRRAIALATVGVAVFLLVRRAGVFRLPAPMAPPSVPPADSPAAAELRDRARQLARTLRLAPDPERAFERLSAEASALGLAEVHLTWVVAELEGASHELVYRWASDATPSAPRSSDGFLVLPLEEQGTSFGHLWVRVVGGDPAAHRPAMELLRDALVDFAIAEDARRVRTDDLPEVVVRIQERRST
jgi:UDP-GlcNAc:undecaprenyl-phosphate GlcNAc-1-phosphate transferase